MSSEKKIQHWELVTQKSLNDYKVFRTRADVARSPRTGEKHEFYIIEGGDWVNVIPITPNQEVVLVEQFRHGSKQIELEIPGGLIDPKDPSPIAAAERELLEETGYRGTRSTLLGQIQPNPAIQDNLLNVALVEGAVRVADIQLDPGEDIRICLVPLSQIDNLIAHGKITHSLVIAAFYLLKLHQQNAKPA